MAAADPPCGLLCFCGGDSCRIYDRLTARPHPNPRPPPPNYQTQPSRDNATNIGLALDILGTNVGTNSETGATYQRVSRW